MSVLLFQPVFVVAIMEGPWLKETVRVTVQVASMGLTVKVSALYIRRLIPVYI